MKVIGYNMMMMMRMSKVNESKEMQALYFFTRNEYIDKLYKLCLYIFVLKIFLKSICANDME